MQIGVGLFYRSNWDSDCGQRDRDWVAEDAHWDKL